MALIASQGTLDWAYPPFILASTAAAMDMEVQIFFTFYGLTLLKKDIKAKSGASYESCHANENAIWSKRISGFRMAHAKCINGEYARI
jgi:Uncharacterized conserved protein